MYIFFSGLLSQTSGITAIICDLITFPSFLYGWKGDAGLTHLLYKWAGKEGLTGSLYKWAEKEGLTSFLYKWVGE